MRPLRRIVRMILIAMLATLHLPAQTVGVRYFYDDLGRLIRVVDQNGNVATYSYDAVGNIVSISRSTVPANNGLEIVGFTPQGGPIGQTVTIQGQGFSPTPSANTVQFNGVTAAVTSASTDTLVANVPTGATTGRISVTVSGQSAQSDSNFTVSGRVAHPFACCWRRVGSKITVLSFVSR